MEQCGLVASGIGPKGSILSCLLLNLQESLITLCLSFPTSLLWDNSEMILTKCLAEVTASGTSHLPRGLFVLPFLSCYAIQARGAFMRLKLEDH